MAPVVYTVSTQNSVTMSGGGLVGSQSGANVESERTRTLVELWFLKCHLKVKLEVVASAEVMAGSRSVILKSLSCQSVRFHDVRENRLIVLVRLKLDF